jgi:hypothetical protein
MNLTGHQLKALVCSGAAVACAVTVALSVLPAQVASAHAKPHHSSSSGASPACNWVTPAEIQKTLGVSAGAPKVRTNASVLQCTYPFTSGAGLAALITYWPHQTISSLVQVTKAAAGHVPGVKISRLTPVSGLGQQAYTMTVEGIPVVTFLQKGTTVQIAGYSPSVTLASEEALGHDISAKM